MGRCRGFGVQSPTDYAFVRHVVNEHLPYYAYGDLRAKHPALPWLTRKLGELYLRLANHRQPSVVIDIAPTHPAYADYFKAGCRRATIVATLEGTERVELLRADIAQIDLEAVLAKADDRTLVAVEGIHRDRAARKAWKAAKASEGVRVTFDLYYLGLLTFDSKRAKQDYTINF